MRTKALILILFFLFPASVFSDAQEPVKILLFYSAHCHPCHKVKEDVLPRLREKYKEKIKIEELDFDKPEILAKLLELEVAYDWEPKTNLTPTAFINGKFLVGIDDIKNYIDMYIDTALSEQGDSFTPKTKASIDLFSRFKLIMPLAVITAGLIDGINPCAFTAIIFFISFLTLQGYGKREVIAIGVSFILAVFITYVLVGFGLFNFLYQLKAYWVIVRALYISGSILCFILAGLAFYDFIKYCRTSQTQEMVLQLPAGLKNKIHQVIGRFYRKGKEGDNKGKRHIFNLILSAFIVGFFVSLFEAICTGQVYLPTIIFVLKNTTLKLKALFYILLYNFMFILPLWIIMLFALWGVSSGKFSRFTHRYIGSIKILMVVIFLGLGLFLVWK
ncbi:MAG: hypothetical protein ABH914_04960 [Candidatus Omnitrophota bacterium]